MARLPRLSLAGQVHHLLQRGNNRQPIFTNDDEYAEMLALLAREAQSAGVAVHAYVLMPNHFHLLATPQGEGGLSRCMQAVGRAYVRRFNLAHGRSGTLWEGRYRSTVLQAERHLLPCMAYFDLNPLRAGLVTAPGDYPWSSHRHYAGLQHAAWLAAPPDYWALGNTPFAREASYTEMVRAGLSLAQHEALTQSVQGGWVLGDEAFVAGLQQGVARRLSRAQPGRPAKTA